MNLGGPCHRVSPCITPPIMRADRFMQLCCSSGNRDAAGTWTCTLTLFPSSGQRSNNHTLITITIIIGSSKQGNMLSKCLVGSSFSQRWQRYSIHVLRFLRSHGLMPGKELLLWMNRVSICVSYCFWLGRFEDNHAKKSRTQQHEPCFVFPDIQPLHFHFNNGEEKKILAPGDTIFHSL